MRLRTLLTLLFAFVLALPAAAQEQRGSIEGVVKDEQDKTVPGVSVETRSAAGAVLTAVTDQSGTYRFPAVLPGLYEVSAKLSGFKPLKVENVQVTIESVKKIDFTLAVGSVTEQVTVTGTPPLVDVKSAERSTIIRGSDSGLPSGRDFTTAITQAPAVNFESKSGGVMIDGSSAAENRYVVDGIETTDIVHGQSGKAVLMDFVDEIQVKSTGYPAEQGGATGGVINVITKSGTNRLSGSVLEYWEGSRLQGGPNKTLRLLLTDNTKAEYVTYGKDSFNRNEIGGSIGGAIIANKAWYFGAYQPSITNTTRTVTAESSTNPRANPSTTKNKNQIQYITASQTTQLGSKLRTRVAFNNNWRKTDGQLASLVGSDLATTIYTKGTTFPNWSLSGIVDYTPTSNLVLSARAGTWVSDVHDFNVNNAVQFNFQTSNVGLAGVPAQFQHPNGYLSVPNNAGTAQDTQSRNFLQFDATYFTRGHQLKAGLQVDRRGENIVSGDLQNDILLTWDGTCGPNNFRGTFGCYEVRSNVPFPQRGILTEGDVHSNVVGLFVQDNWSVSPRLSVQAGIRTESEKVPAYTTQAGINPNPISFGFGDKVAPRLGFAYDVRGDGTDKVYASWGVFYDIFKLRLPQGSFGGDKWISYYFTLDTPNFESLRDSASCPPSCPGTPSSPVSIDFRAVSVTPGTDIEPNLKPMRSQELSFGYERQLNTRMAAYIRFVHKHLDTAIDDVGSIGDVGEAYIIGNPGEGVTAKFDISSGLAAFSPFGATKLTQTMPLPKRAYNSVEFSLRRQFSDNYMFNLSYLWSRLQGNYSGLSQSDENGRSDPNVGRDFDYPVMMFDGKGQPLDGPLNTDRTHQIKFQGLYQFKFGTQIGLNQSIQSGIPISRQTRVIPGSNFPVFYRGRLSDGRTPVFSQTDINVQHRFVLAGGRAIILQANVLNLFNQRTALDVHNNQRRTGAIPCTGGLAGTTGGSRCPGAITDTTFSEARFYAGQMDWDAVIAAQAAAGRINLDARFLQENSFQAPTQVRFGFKFTF